MSWQLVSFLILAAVLIGGFAWYERSRPPAQVVALVAALAALAIAGRIAFAAFPNVKPTTDIVIFAGYALGPAAGFAVGALAALVSNFWFGQGPWTPWQMAAWGLCGILGAGLALGSRNVGRLTLAAVCGLAAVGYGAILNFSLIATYGGELSWQRFWIFEGRAVPFEIAHAAGNVAFALIAGPAMVRMLVRFRERFEWRRTEVGAIGPPQAPTGRRTALPTGAIAFLLAAVLIGGAFGSAQAQAAAGSGPEAAAAWLESVQNEDGGWSESKGSGSSQQMTGWVMLGLEAAGVNPQDVTSGGISPIDYLQSEVAAIQSPGDLARTILALEGAGIEPRDFAGRNLVAALLAKRRPDGSYEGWPNSTAYAVLALRSAGIGNVADSLEWLREVQNEDGGWGDVAGSPSNADGTGAVLQVFSPSSKASQRGVGYLRQVQQKGGGFRLGGNGALNTQSTGRAIEGLLAAGANPTDFRRGGKSAYEYLEDNQAADGHYRYSSKSDQTPIWVTGDVLVGAAKRYLPLAAVPRAPQPQVTPTPTPETTPAPLPLPESGGVTPAPTPTPVLPQESGASPQVQHGKIGHGKTGSEGVTGGVGPGAGTGAPPGEAEEVIPEAGSPIEPRTDEALSTGEPVDESGSDGDGSVLGSIVAGLIAGGILFAIGYGPYKRRQVSRAARPTPASPGPAPASPDPASASPDPAPPSAPPTAASSPPVVPTPPRSYGMATPPPLDAPNPPPINAAPPSGPPRSP
ncbi:MAG TPA: prenyltransferase/squalene oxidase repeat-containing protein [Solirubrobacterales bacterium]|nr:prenyltransferase/squalene oxidase repeat-containing protein [Solirubrobacterales bacterium]